MGECTAEIEYNADAHPALLQKTGSDPPLQASLACASKPWQPDQLSIQIYLRHANNGDGPGNNSCA